MSDNALTVVPNNKLAIMPVMSMTDAKMRRQAVIDFTKQVMVQGVDYGIVPGTNKDTLLKPGAEKLTSLFGLSPRFETAEKVTDWTGKDHGGEPFFYFQYTCSLYYGDILAGQGIGSCNSWEKKYRYRKAELACPSCGQVGTIIKGKAEYGGGWVCFNKKGGCGEKFGDKAPAIVDQPRGDIPNPNPADLVNTVDKMAQKRALVAATLIAVNASEFFTQDVEDMDFGIVEGEYEPIPQKAPPTKQPQAAKPQQQKPAAPVNWAKVPETMSPAEIPQGGLPSDDEEPGTWGHVEEGAASNATKPAPSKGKHDMTPADPAKVDVWRRKVENGKNLRALTVAGMVKQAVPYFDSDHHALRYVDYGATDPLDNAAALEMFDGLVKIAADKVAGE